MTLFKMAERDLNTIVWEHMLRPHTKADIAKAHYELSKNNAEYKKAYEMADTARRGMLRSWSKLTGAAR